MYDIKIGLQKIPQTLVIVGGSIVITLLGMVLPDIMNMQARTALHTVVDIVCDKYLVGIGITTISSAIAFVLNWWKHREDK